VIHNLEFEDLISKLFEFKDIDMVITKDDDVRIMINDDEYSFEYDYDFDTNIMPRVITTFLSLDNMELRKLLFDNKGNIVIQKGSRRLLLKNVTENDILLIDGLYESINNLRKNNKPSNQIEEYVLYQIINNYFGHLKENINIDLYEEIYDINKDIIDNNSEVYEAFEELEYENSLYNTDEFTKNYVVNKEKNKKELYQALVKNERLEELEGELNMGKKNKKEKNNFAQIINEPIKEEIKIVEDEYDVLRLGAVEQAKMLLEVMKERDSIKKDAEEFAKTILEKQKERRQILKAAEEQARRIIMLERENDELKKLAEENARIILDKEIQENKEILRDANEYAKIIYAKQAERKSLLKAAEEQARKIFELERENAELRRLAEENAKNLFARENKYRNEVKLREIDSAVPVDQSDLDKLYNLLNALTAVENIDFAINRPTVLQEVVDLETKIETYITTHNIVNKEEKVDSSDIKTETQKTNDELLGILRSAYTESHNYEREGRHSLINVTPEDEKIRVTIYSVKDDTDDVLTEVHFDGELFEDSTIKELCEIYKNGAIIVASKTDNLPGDLQDYLVIDSQDNAIKFMGCDKDIVERAKAYL
jgi:hypothetical protein